MNLLRFLPQAPTRLKLGILLCSIWLTSSICGLAQSQSQPGSGTANGSSSAPTSQINNPGSHNVSTGNYVPPPPPSGPDVYYNHRWDIYGGAGYTNFLAGPRLIQRSNMGGWEAAATYWLNWHWGITGDARQYIGTSGVFPNTAGGATPPNPCKPYQSTCYNNPTITGPRIMQYYFMGGPEYRFLRRTKASGTFHAFFGRAWGIFDAANLHGLDVRTIGLFPTQWTFASSVGGTFDYNYSPRIAFRIQPEVLVTRYSGTAQQNFGFSVGPIFRFGKLDTSGNSSDVPKRHHRLHNIFHR